MKSRLYETVTDVPVLIPAELLPGHPPAGKRTFLIWRKPIQRPRIKGDKTPRPMVPADADRPVLVLRSKDLQSESRIGKQIWRILGAMERKHLIETLVLRKVLDWHRSLRVLESFYRKLQIKIWDDDHDARPKIRIPKNTKRPDVWKQLEKFFSEHWIRSHDFALDLERASAHPTVVAGLVSNALKDARLVLWWSGSQFVPAIWCEDLESAVYALTLPFFAGGESLGICAWCTSIFVKNRADQNHCCERHANAQRVSKWRRQQRRRPRRDGKA